MKILGLVDIPLSLVLVVLVVVFVYVYQTWYFSLFKQLGIPGPPPRVFVGNVPMGKNTDMLASLEENKAKYGRNYGMFLFRDPVFLTSDPDFIKEVGVKLFNNFTDKWSGFEHIHTDFDWMMIFNARGQAWRRYRHVMTPAFTTGKLKALQGYIIKCSEVLGDVLKEKAKAGEDIDLKDVYQRFTMDVIAGTAFGLDTDLQTGSEGDTHHMVKAMKGILSNLSQRAIVLVVVCFPFLSPVVRALGYSTFPQKDLDFFKQCITDIIRQRDQNPDTDQRAVDFLQQMMDVRVAPGEHVTDTQDTSGTTKTNKKLTEEEVLAQGIQIFNAGFETTSSTLRYLTYSLATEPHVQDALLEEIVNVVGDGPVTYEHLQNLKYTECVILETLRMYPILPMISRKALEPMEVQGFHIPAGMGIVFAVYTATHDPEIYPDPYTFTPSRFLDDKDTLMKSLPFGVGPRQCIGMRLAMQELKTALVHVCRAVRFVPCDKTQKPLELDATAFLAPKEPIFVKAELRADLE